MPLYEYLCENCNSKFELMRPMGRFQEGADCPCCEGSSHRVFSVFTAFSSGIGTVATRQSSERAPMGAVAGTGGCPACAGGTCGCGH